MAKAQQGEDTIKTKLLFRNWTAYIKIYSVKTEKWWATVQK